jgi:hypothetical protein
MFRVLGPYQYYVYCTIEAIRNLMSQLLGVQNLDHIIEVLDNLVQNYMFISLNVNLIQLSLLSLWTSIDFHMGSLPNFAFIS